MPQVISSNKVPEGSISSKSIESFNYCDSYRIGIISNDSVDAITTKIFSVPAWVLFLLNARNRVVKIFGLQTGKKINKANYYPVGSKAVMFTVVDRNENEIVMSEKDKHLDFVVSVMLEKNSPELQVSVTTIVKFNRGMGSFYFMIVKPFHRLIVKSLVKNLANKKL